MAEPTSKSPEVERVLEGMFGHNRVNEIRANRCVSAPLGCGADVVPEIGTEKGMFTDALSLKEYSISGFCQPCQGKIFNLPEE